MRKVYSAESAIDAQLLHDQLAVDNIESVIKGEFLAGAVGELPLNQLVTVWVKDESDYTVARRIAEAFDHQLSKTKSSDIMCIHCGNTNPAGFEVCWNCGTSLSS